MSQKTDTGCNLCHKKQTLGVDEAGELKVSNYYRHVVKCIGKHNGPPTKSLDCFFSSRKLQLESSVVRVENAPIHTDDHSVITSATVVTPVVVSDHTTFNESTSAEVLEVGMTGRTSVSDNSAGNNSLLPPDIMDSEDALQVDDNQVFRMAPPMIKQEEGQMII